MQIVVGTSGVTDEPGQSSFEVPEILGYSRSFRPLCPRSSAPRPPVFPRDSEGLRQFFVSALRFAPPPDGYFFPSSAVRSSVTRTLRVHGCSLAFGDG